MNIKLAKQIPLEDALVRLGYAPSRTSGHDIWFASPFRDESEPSFKVNTVRNLWYDFGAGEGGDLIDLVKQLYQNTVSDALAQIDELEGSTPPPTRTRPPPSNDNQLATNEPAFTVMENQPLTSRSLIAYLNERGIPASIARQHVRELHYQRGDKTYFAIGLANERGGFEIRNRYFKGTIGNKDLSIIPGEKNRVFVFEGLFDYLTALTMFDGKLDGTAVVLNSVAMKDRAAEAIRAISPSTVELYQDADPSGEDLANYLKEQLPDITVVDWSSLYAEHNDLNEWFVANQVSKAVDRSYRRIEKGQPSFLT